MALKKPDFSFGGGFVVDPKFIPEAVRAECMLHLNRSSLTQGQKDAILGYANDLAQHIVGSEPLRGAIQRRQIKAVRDAAHALQVAINKLGHDAEETLVAHTEYLGWGSAPPVRLPDIVLQSIRQPGEPRFLSDAWDWAQALELAADYAAGQFTPTQSSKPAEMRARGFVSMLAEHIRDLTGQLPPADQASWFAPTARCLGAHLGMKIGPRLIASGIRAVR